MLHNHFRLWLERTEQAKTNILGICNVHRMTMALKPWLTVMDQPLALAMSILSYAHVYSGY